MQHAKDFNLKAPVVLDPKHRLAKSTGATITPEAVVLMPDGQAVYRGRINDRFPKLGTDSVNARTHDLRRALLEFLAGKPVSEPQTSAVGCFIE